MSISLFVVTVIVMRTLSTIEMCYNGKAISKIPIHDGCVLVFAHPAPIYQYNVSFNSRICLQANIYYKYRRSFLFEFKVHRPKYILISRQHRTQ